MSERHLVPGRTARWAGALSAGALLLAASSAWALEARHPQHDDRGTLAWARTPAAAYAAATAQGRLVLVVAARPDDPAAREFLTQVVPDAAVAPRLRALCVGLALDSRVPEPGIDRLFGAALGLSSATPAVAFVSADGRWITGFRGAATLPRFLQHLNLAEAAGRAPARAPRAASSLPPPTQRVVSGAARLPSSEDPRLSSMLVRLTPGSTPPSGASSRAQPLATARPAEAGLGAPRAAVARPLAAGPMPAATDPSAAAASASLRARQELDRALAQVLAGRRDEALDTLRGVRRTAPGLPEATEAERGIDAIQTAADLERLSDPRGVLAETLRRTKRDELRGTRWARLFAG